MGYDVGIGFTKLGSNSNILHVEITFIDFTFNLWIVLFLIEFLKLSHTGLGLRVKSWG